MHIQKTSGSSWEKHIIEHLEIKREIGLSWEPACIFNKKSKRKLCLLKGFRKTLFWDAYTSRYCDMHADYTELSNCILQDYHNRIIASLTAIKITPDIGVPRIITFLRDPVQRYISEYEHVKKGATWSKAIRSCSQEPIHAIKCYKGDSWSKSITWKDFLTCEYNLANNRQVRMLANYNILGCKVLKCWTKSSVCSSKDKHINEQKLLQSAKNTLVNQLSFFGLSEYQNLSEYLFIKTFGENKFKFSVSIRDLNQTTALNATINGHAGIYIEKIRENNHLDIQLYEFAKEVFFKRVEFFHNLDNLSL